ncbi:unnamed protein product [Paramecium sonneborni]|uniref:Mini antigen n=1 Tax=Paramecium sonneborni TaxID=65129 RepID=A0A8S1K811_9CILI|nr:unnamed protein product [Paramecium sonneborni]
MNKFIIVSCLIALTFGLTIDTTGSCTCNDLHIESECKGQLGCNWSAGACQKPNCTALGQDVCSKTNQLCAWVNNTCTTFSSCSSLTGNSIDNCTAQNMGCSWQSGDKCATQSCSLYGNNNTQYCIAPFCVLSGSTCSSFSNCGSFNDSATCIKYPCLYNTNATKCESLTCSNITDQAACNTIYLSEKQSSLCFWNNSTCVDLTDLKNLTSTSCLTNTNGAYHWSSSNASDGSCTQCYGLLLQIVFALILLLA